MTKRRHKKRGIPQRPDQPAAVQVAAPLDRVRDFRYRDRNDLIQVGIVLGLAFALRMLFLYLNQRNNPVFHFPIMDALYHHDWATDILSGETHGGDVFFRGPFYPYLLAALYRISDSSITFVVFCQHLLGTFTAGLVFLLAREYFSPRVALLAGLGAAAYWPAIYFEGDLLIVTTFIFLNTLSFLFFAKAQKHHSLKWFFLAGIVLGTSAITRPSIFVLFPFVPLFIFVTARNRPRGTPDWIKRTIVVAAASAIAIMPVMIRNYVVAGSVVPVAASGGVNFYIGNNSASDGSTAIVPGTRADWWGGYEDAIAIAERDIGQGAGLARISDYYFKRGMEFIGSRPDEAWPHMFRKLRVFWSGPERANNKFIYFFWQLAGMKYVPLPGFPLVAPLGLLGMFLLWRRKRELAVLYLFVSTYSLGVIAFFVNARFRLPIMPVMIVFGAYGAVFLVTAYRQKSLRLISALVVVSVAALIVNAEFMWFERVRAYSNAISHSTLGNAYLQMGLKDTALRHYQTAEGINRANPTQAYGLIARDVDYNIGNLLWGQGLCSRAIEVLQRVTGNDVYALTAQDHLGDCYLRRGDLDRAFAAYARVAQIDPDDIRGPVGMGRCHLAARNYEEAERILSGIVDPTHDVYPPAWIALAEVQVATGQLQEAIESYRGISRFIGYEKDALYSLAEIYQRIGDYDSALSALQEARKYVPVGDPSLEALINRVRSRR
ncbi:MAG: tetratricopeptide repeat protein [Candidatus Krumholzibacteriota bacterium]|nr:tetratricopeptide repeat protein [Candidatus Krumholzibacteriota bacterium]